MKRLLFATTFLTLVMITPHPTMAQVQLNLGISFGLPSPILFAAPPEVIVLPETDNVYAVPGIDVDLFFWNGWWWRPWYGRWYRSRYYDRGWVYYNSVPRFYYDVDPGWRGYYTNRYWRGNPWNYERISYQRFQRNWHNWHRNRYWERQRTWGVQGYRPPTQAQRQELRHQREREYFQRTEVQQHRQLIQQQQQRQRELRAQQRGQQQRLQPQGKPEGGRGERRR